MAAWERIHVFLGVWVTALHSDPRSVDGIGPGNVREDHVALQTGGAIRVPEGKRWFTLIRNEYS